MTTRARAHALARAPLLSRVDSLLSEYSHVDIDMGGLTVRQKEVVRTPGQTDAALIGRVIRMGNLLMVAGLNDPVNYPWLKEGKGRDTYCMYLRRQLTVLAGRLPFNRPPLPRPESKEPEVLGASAMNYYSSLLSGDNDQEVLDRVIPIPEIPIGVIRASRTKEVNEVRRRLKMPLKTEPKLSEEDNQTVQRRERIIGLRFQYSRVIKAIREVDFVTLLVIEARIERLAAEMEDLGMHVPIILRDGNG